MPTQARKSPPNPPDVRTPDRSLAGLDPRLAKAWHELKRLMRLSGHPIFLTEGYRSDERQAFLYAQGRTSSGPRVTNARPGESKHNTRAYGHPASRALDFAFKSPNREVGVYDESHPWSLVSALAPYLGLKSGESFGDRPHLELFVQNE